MAALTATALGATAATTAAIGAGVAGATALAGGTMSLVQASKQRKAGDVAQKSSQKLMLEAKKEIEKQEYENLNIPKEAFEAQTIANAGLISQGVDALTESGPRSLAAGIGKLNAAGNVGTEAMRVDMGKALYENQVMKADARQNQNNELASMAVGQAADQEQIARDMEEAATANTMSGFSSLGSAISSVASAVPLYTKSRQDRRIGQMMNSDQFGGIDFSATGANKVGMTRLDPTTGAEMPLFEQNPLFVKGAKEGETGFGETQYTDKRMYRAMNDIEKRKILTDNYSKMFPKGRDYRRSRGIKFGDQDFQKYYN